MSNPMHRLTAVAAAILFCMSSAHAQTQQTDAPPRASLIQVTANDDLGNSVVVGSAGAVAANAALAVLTTDTGHFVVGQAAADGSFRLPLFAPPGTSVLVKTAPATALSGFRGALDTSFGSPNWNGVVQNAGTIVQVPGAAAAGNAIPISGASWLRAVDVGGPSRPVWTVQGTISSLAAAPGDSIRVQGAIRLFSAQLPAAVQGNAAVVIEKLTGSDGTATLSADTFASTFLTPTGLPIERLGSCCALSQGASVTFDKTIANGVVEGLFNISYPISNSLLPGYYRLALSFSSNLSQDAQGFGNMVQVDNAHRKKFSSVFLPIIRIGEPAAPKIPWTLLSDTVSNGSRGVGAIEDRSSFAFAPRIMEQADVLVIPRLDESGQPARYRLEPFAPTVSLVDRGGSDPPLVPFRFPSGSLTVRITKPDGSTEQIGPAPFVQDRMRTPNINFGGGAACDVYQLSTLDPRFEVTFAQDGKYTIEMTGSIQDVWGTTWSSKGTYEVQVAKFLTLDTAVLPGQPFDVGDMFTSAMTVIPAAAADIEVRFRLAPQSDPSRMQERVLRGRANAYGYFNAGSVEIAQAGEYRVDITASYRDDDGNLWFATRTFGGAVSPLDTPIILHGRRGVDPQPAIGSQWFLRSQTGRDTGVSPHVPWPYHAGDVSWMAKTLENSIPFLSIQDPNRVVQDLLKRRTANSPPLFSGAGTFDDRAAAGELPLFSSRSDGIDPHMDPSRVDLWAYFYKSAQKPLVRIREIISEDYTPQPYWAFASDYAHQIGVSTNGDLPNDFKFLFGGAVMRGSALAQPLYATYASLWVMVPDDDSRGGTRTFPPFQGNGGGPSGGPLMTVKGRAIDMFFHPTAVRPGSVLEVGDRFSFAGLIGPPCAANVSATVTLPDGKTVVISGTASRLGYYYRSPDDFIVTTPGMMTVDVKVTYSGKTSAGQLTAPFPTGDILGTANGRFYVYVVPKGAPPLNLNIANVTKIDPLVASSIQATPAAGYSLTSGHVSTVMPGFVLETASPQVAGGALSYRYDWAGLSRDFPNLDHPIGGDAVTISVFGSVVNRDNQPSYAARVINVLADQFVPLRPASAGTVVNANGTLSFNSNGNSVISAVTPGANSTVRVSYARVQPAPGSTSPAGFAVTTFRQDGIVVSEAALPLTPALRDGRLAVDLSGSLNTGVAILNPGSDEARITFSAVDSAGRDAGSGSFTLAGGNQLARFVTEAPFSLRAGTIGSLTLNSSAPIAVVALRGLSNERQDFLMTPAPVTDLADTGTARTVIPHFASGGGWTTRVILVNTRSEAMTGSIQMIGSNGAGIGSVSYTIASNSSSAVTLPAGSSVQVGSLRIAPAGGSGTPASYAVFSFVQQNITVTEAVVPASPASSTIRLYAEMSDAVKSGLAITNTSGSQANVALELRTIDGRPTGLRATLTIPANGHTALFLDQIPQFAALPSPFQGQLVLTTSAGTPVAALALRSRQNQRNDFLISTAYGLAEPASASAAETYIPQLVDGGGYTTQLVLLNSAQSISGALRFYTVQGQPVDVLR